MIIDWDRADQIPASIYNNGSQWPPGYNFIARVKDFISRMVGDQQHPGVYGGRYQKSLHHLLMLA